MSLLERKEWGNSIIHVFGTDRPLVVVKQGKRWTPELARKLHDDATQLAKRLTSIGSFTFIPEPLAVTDDPPALCMEFVEGQDAWKLMKAEMQSRAPDLEQMRRLVAAWARSLADYHRADHSGRNSAAAVPELKKIARRMGVRWSRARTIAGWEKVRRAFHDVGLHNIRLTNDGRCALFDLPEHELIRPVHADVASALAWIDDALRDAPFSKRSAFRRLLVQAFLETYASSRLIDLDAEGDRWWILFWQTWAQISWMRTAARRRHHFQLLENAARAATNRLLLFRRNGL